MEVVMMKPCLSQVNRLMAAAIQFPAFSRTNAEGQ